MRLALLALLATTALHARAEAGACGHNTPLTPHVLNDAASRGELPADGGIVVASLPGNEMDEAHKPRPPVGADVIALAPGLALHRAAGAKSTGKPPARMAAPVVRAVRFSPSRGMHGSDSVIAELARKPPAGALALVLLESNKAHTPRSWGLVTADDGPPADPAEALTIAVYSMGGRCVETIQGLIPSAVGDHVVLAWVDPYGRLSALSSPITVTKAKSQP